MDEQRVNDMLQALTAQRDGLANQVVVLQADLMALQREVDSLKSAQDGMKQAEDKKEV